MNRPPFFSRDLLVKLGVFSTACVTKAFTEVDSAALTGVAAIAYPVVNTAANWVAGLSGNLAASSVDANAAADKAWDDLLHNEDLTNAIGQMLRKRLEIVSSQWPEPHPPVLSRLVKGVAEHWASLSREETVFLQPLADNQITEQLTAWLQHGEASPLTSDEWQVFFGSMLNAEERKDEVTLSLIQKLGSIVAEYAVHDLVEILKDDFENGGKAYAAVSIRFFASLTEGVDEIRIRIEEILNHNQEWCEFLANQANESKEETHQRIKESTFKILTSFDLQSRRLGSAIDRIGQDLRTLVQAQEAEAGDLPQDELDQLLAKVIEQVLEATGELDLIGRKEPMLSDERPRQLFQPLPLAHKLSAEEQDLLSFNLEYHPTATEMAAINMEAVEESLSILPDGVDLSQTLDDLYDTENTFSSPQFTRTLEEVSFDELFEEKEGLTKLIAPRLVLLGAPGGGKSVLLRYLAQQFALGKMRYKEGVLTPVVIRLSRWCQFVISQRNSKLECFLSDQYSHFNSAQWSRQLEKGNTLLLLDGLDEVHDPEDLFVSVLKKALNTYRSCPAAITCRTFAFTVYRSTFKNYSVYQLGRLTDTQIRNYCHAYAANTGVNGRKLEAKVEEAITNKALHDLAGNPLLLSVICFVLGGPSNDGRPLAVRAQLFDDAVTQLLKRSRQVAEPLPQSLSAIRRQILELASLEIFSRQSGQDKAVILDESLVIRSFRFAAEKLKYDDRNGIAILQDAIERGLIEVNEEISGNPLYTYLHLQFHEYLAGCGLSEDPNFVQQLFDRLSSPRWREVILLAIGQLAISRKPGNRKFLEVIGKIVDYRDPFACFVPRAALLLVNALPDLTRLPYEVVETLTNEIIEAYSDFDRIKNFPELAPQLEEAFTQLSTIDSGECVLPILLESFDGVATAPGKAMTAAILVRAAKLYNSDTIGALIEIYRADCAEWGWPIDSALRDVVANDSETSLLDAHVPFRRLMNSPARWESFVTDPQWRWIGFSIFGGTDFGLLDHLDLMIGEADELQILLAQKTLSPEERSVLEADKKEKDEQVKEIKARLHHLGPQYFYRPSALGLWCWRAFEGGRTGSEVLVELFARLPSIHEFHEKFDALLALSSSYSITSLMAHVSEDEQFANALTRFDSLLSTTVESALREGLVESDSVLDLMEENHRGHFIAAVNRATWSYTGLHPVTLSQARSATDPEAKALRLAEFLQRSFLEHSDDKVYNWCVLLDTVGKAIGGDPNNLMLALSIAHGVGNARPWQIEGWALDPLSPNMNGRPLQAILGAALDALEAIPPVFDFVRGWAISCLVPLIREAGMDAEAKLLTLTSVSTRFGSLNDTWNLLNDSEGIQGVFPRDGFFISCESDDPYVISRFLLASRRFALDSKIGFNDVFLSIKSVPDPVLREWLFERLLISSNCLNPEIVLEAAREALPLISWGDCGNRTRAALRLAALDLEYSEDALSIHLNELGAELVTIDQGVLEMHVGSLAIIWPYIKGRQPLIELFDSVLARLPNELARHAARGLSAFEMDEAVKNEPESMTPLKIAAVVSDFKHLLGVPNNPEELWLALATEKHSSAFIDLLELSRTHGGLFLGRTGALALARISGQKEWKIVRHIIPLIRKFDPIARPLIRQFMDNSQPDIRIYASLIYAESTELNAETLPLLTTLLESDEYLVRRRAALALHGDRTEEALPPIASRLGRPAVEEIANHWKNYPNDLRISLCLGWVLERIRFDDPDQIRAWTTAANGGGSDAKVAQNILSNIGHLTDFSWKALLAEFLEHPRKAGRLIMRSICVQASNGSLTAQRIAEFSQTLAAIPQAEIQDDVFIANGPLSIVTAAEKVLKKMEGNDMTRAAIGATCREEFLSKRESRAAALEGKSGAELVEQLAHIGSLRKIGPRYHSRVSEAACMLEGDPSLMMVLIPWLMEEVQYPADGDPDRGYYYYLSGDLLSVLAEAAELFPGEFRSYAKKYQRLLIRRLSEAVRTHDTFPGRQAALRLLAVIGRIDSDVTNAIFESLKDVLPVQSAALNSLESYRWIDSRFVSSILDHLKSVECPTFCYLLSKALSCVARNVFLEPEIRDQLVAGFREAMQTKNIQRDVYFVKEVDNGSGGTFYQLVNLGRLDRLLYRELLELSGVVMQLSGEESKG